MFLDLEQRLQARCLFLGQQAGAGLQSPPSPVERVVPAAAVTVQFLLDPPPARVGGCQDFCVRALDLAGLQVWVDAVGVDEGEFA